MREIPIVNIKFIIQYLFVLSNGDCSNRFQISIIKINADIGDFSIIISDLKVSNVE
jgi:hypothetical protein